MSLCVLNGIFDGCEVTAGSREHIIPNAIGGRLSSDKLICNSCNNKSGSAWDAVLCNQYTILCVWFGVSRERGNVPNCSVENEIGEISIISNDGKIQPKKPTFSSKKINENECEITVKANNHKDAKKIISSFCKKNNLQPDFTTLQHREVLFNDHGGDTKFSFDLSGPQIGRSVAKMMYLYSLHVGVDRESMKDVFKYLSAESNVQPFGPYYDVDLILKRPENIPIHVISVCGKNNRIIGYIELFGLFKYVFNLSSDYHGNDFCHTYALDPVSGDILDATICFDRINSSVEQYLKPEVSTVKKFESWLTDKLPFYKKSWDESNKQHHQQVILQQVKRELALKSFTSEEELDIEIGKIVDKIFEEKTQEK